MVFSSLTFICIFLPVVWLGQLILPKTSLKNALLLIASVLFYAYGEPVYVILLILSALGNYLAALMIGSREGERDTRQKVVLALAVIMNLALLGIFKYADLAAQALSLIPGVSVKGPGIALPVGISFYTFQAMSYVIDVYRGRCSVQKNFFKLLLYISFFPQLIAGPIVRYVDIEKEIDVRTVTLEDTAAGVRRFIAGLCKKVLIANYCGAVADTLFAAQRSDIWCVSAWIAAVAYMLQIYFDFSGYSDMAIGMGHMFGFNFLENFNYPYISASIREFWRRWHISLSTWLQEYLYIPLGGNRKGKVRTVINKFIVFLCCGIWHGANVTFLFWGFYHGCLMLIEEAVPFFKRKEHSLPGKIFAHVYTLLAVLIGFVFFRADTFLQGLWMVGTMFDVTRAASASAVSLMWTVLTPANILAVAAGVIASMPVKAKAEKLRGYGAASYAVSLAALVLCILNLAGGSYNPFIYFRF